MRYSNLKLFFLTAALAVSCELFPKTANADLIGLTFTGGSTSTSGYTRGFEFTTANPITITGLGWWDSAGSGGLASSHQVDIWDTSGDQLLTATVASGTGETLLDGFRFDSNLTGTAALPAGTYVIGGLSTTPDLVAYDVPSADVTLGSGITYLEDRSNGADSFAFPSSTQGLNDGVFGPDFTFTAAPVPEPASLGILGIAAAGVLARRRRSECVSLSSNVN